MPRLEDEVDTFDGLAPGTTLAATSNLFPRIEVKKDVVQAPADKKSTAKAVQETKKPADKKTPATVATGTDGAGKELVEFSRFQALDLRVGTVLRAEKHPNADRILKLEIDFGEAEPRQILSGLAAHYAPEALVGRQVCAILNLPPRTIRGLVSQGMVLTAGDDATLALLSVDKPVPNGGRIA